MFSRFVKLLPIIILILCLDMLFIGKFTAQDSYLPYIHYYDRLNNRLIFERADGANSYAIEDSGNGVPDWSPSGQWMILGNRRIFSTDGTQEIINPQADSSLEFYTEWARDSDILLIVGTNWQTGMIHIQLFDVENEIVLASYQDVQFGIDTTYIFHLYWSADSQQAYVYWRSNLAIVSQNGSIAVEHTTYNAPFTFDSGRFIHYDWVDFMIEDGVIIEDVNTRDFVQIEELVNRGFHQPYYVYWSSNLDYALIYARPCDDESCEAWVKLVNWQTGDITTITPTLRLQFEGYDCEYDFICHQMWSPNNQSAIITDKETQTSYVINAQTGAINTLSNTQYYHWIADETLVIRFTDDDKLHQYNPRTNDLSEISTEDNLNLCRFEVSPSYQYIVSLCEQQGTILNLNGNLIASTLPHSHSIGAIGHPTSYTWHPSEQWLMATYTIAIAGGGNGPSASILFNLDQTLRRELPTSGNAGFVPERAIPYLSQDTQTRSLKKDPIVTLPASGRLLGVGWHPTDPNQLLVYDVEGQLTFWSIEDGIPRITDEISIQAVQLGFYFPDGMKVHWFPEIDEVLFSAGDMLHTVDNETAEFVPISNLLVNYPQLNTDIEADWRLAANLNGFMSLDPARYLNAETGQISEFDFDGLNSTMDANSEIAVVGYQYNCCINVYNLEDGRLIDTFFATAFSLALSPDGQRLATTSVQQVNIWDMSDYYLSAVSQTKESVP
ncbi:MAG: hypothetical protein AAFV93_01905 [Chloroflexota bacterium]